MLLDRRVYFLSRCLDAVYRFLRKVLELGLVHVRLVLVVRFGVVALVVHGALNYGFYFLLDLVVSPQYAINEQLPCLVVFPELDQEHL